MIKMILNNKIATRYLLNTKFESPICKPWNQIRSTHFLKKCKDCLGSIFHNPAEKDLSESCSPAQKTTEELSPTSEMKVAVPRCNSLNKVNVVILGAGMAGLSAANHLYQNGIENITVLEALQRPGGRIQSTWFGDSVIELGSPIMKNPVINPIIETAFEDGLTEITLNKADLSRGLLLRNDGSIIPYPISYEVYTLFKAILNEANSLEQSGENKYNKMKFIGSRIEQEVRAFPPNFQADANRAFHGLACATINKSIHDSSLIKTNNLGTFVKLPGSQLQVPLGHFGAIDKLYQSLPKNIVKFGKSVIKIRWGGVSNVFPRAVVICEDGESFKADFVIITLSVNVLKALSDSLFCPELPVSKLNAICKIPQVHVNKLFLQFPQQFWMWNKHLEKIILDPEILRCKEGWIKGLYSIEPIQGSDRVMCLTVTGPEALCFESIDDKQVVSDIIPFIQELTRSNVPDPVCVTRSCWSSNPHFLGAYSCMAASMAPRDFYNMALPLPEESEYCNPVLLFAGEATCSVQYGTVKGAVTSGIREAERLIQLARVLEETKKECETLFN